MREYKLSIELIPESAWGNNLRETLPKKDWDTLREFCYTRFDNHCAVCGKYDESLDAHEVWDFKEHTKEQVLIDIIALCKSCHFVKHIRQAKRIGAEKHAREHFKRINKCNDYEFASAMIEAEFKFNELSKMDTWTLTAPTLDQLGGEGMQITQRVKIDIINPYDGVEWETVSHVKSALHTHTINSLPVDPNAGTTAPNELVDAYEKSGFGAVVVTDHDFVSTHNSSLITTYGNELSKEREHILSYGTTYQDLTGAGIAGNLIGISTAGGIAYISHPSRHKGTSHDKNATWWIDKIIKNDVIKGMGALSGRQLSRDHGEEIWDEILTETMPRRNIFGIGIDDNHSVTDISPSSVLGAAYTTIMLDDSQLNEQGLIHALATGCMTFSSHKIDKEKDQDKPRLNIPCPKVLNISIDKHEATITVKADYADRIEWISNGKIVKKSYNSAGKLKSKINLRDVDGSYVRFRLLGPGGQTLSQPFGLIKS